MIPVGMGGSNTKKRLKGTVILIILGLLFNASNLFGAACSGSPGTYYTRASGNWNNCNTWSTTGCNGSASGTSPGAGSTVVICSGHTVNLNVGGLTIASLTIEPGGKLNLQGQNITVSGNTILQGTDAEIYASATATFTSNGDFTMNPNSLLNVNGNANLNVNIYGKLTMIPGTSGTLLYTGSNGGDFTVYSGNAEVTAGPGYVGIGRSNATFYDPACPGGCNTSKFIINGDFRFIISGAGFKRFRHIYISPTGTFNNANGEDPEIDGNLICEGNWINCTGGTCEYRFGRNLPTQSPVDTIKGVSLLQASRIRIFNAITVFNIGTLIVNGNVNPGIAAGGGGTPKFYNGDGVNYAYLSLQNNGLDGVDNAINFYASLPNNTVEYSRANNQNIRVPTDNCYYNLILSNSGNKVAQGNFGIKNQFIIKDNAIFIDNGFSITECSGSTATLILQNNAQWQSTSCLSPFPQFTGGINMFDNSTIVLQGNCNQALSPGNYANITINAPGVTKDLCNITTLTGNLNIQNGNVFICNNLSCSSNINLTGGTLNFQNNVTIGNLTYSGGTINDNGWTITVCGSSWTKNGGTYNSTGTVVFDPNSGSASVLGGVIETFNNLNIAPLKTLIGHPTNINIKGNWTNDGNFNHNNGTVTFTGPSSSILGTSVTTFNNLSILAGASLTGHPLQINIEGNWTNNGTYIHNNGEVIFLGSKAQTLGGTSTTAFWNLTINKAPGTMLSQAAATTQVANLLYIIEGIYNVGTNTLNGSGGITMTGGELRLAKLATVPELTGTYSMLGGTVTLNGAGPQTLNTAPPGASTYYNLNFINSGAKKITGLLTINGDVYVGNIATLTSNSNFQQNPSKNFQYSSGGLTTLVAGSNISVGNYIQTAGTLDISWGTIMHVKGTYWNKTGGTFLTNGTVIFDGATAQTFTDNGTTFYNVEINNPNNLYLNNNMQIRYNLKFTQGNIITGPNVVIMTLTVSTVTRISGHVDGYLRKYFGSVGIKTYEVGSGSSYTPVNINLTSGSFPHPITVRANQGDHPLITSSMINPSKTVNRHWDIINNGGASAALKGTFHFIDPTDKDPALSMDPTDLVVGEFDGATWTELTPVGAVTASSVESPPLSLPAGATRSYQIGNRYNPALWWTRVKGPGNLWSNPATWIQDRTGTINVTAGNTTVTGTGTKFTTELQVGDVIMFQSNPSIIIGTVASIASDVSLTLSTPSPITGSGSYGRQRVPTSAENADVYIGNPNLPDAPVEVIVDISNASALRLSFTKMKYGNSLIFNPGSILSLSTTLRLWQPNTAGTTNLVSVGDGTLNVGGLLIGDDDASTNGNALLTLGNGTINISSSLNMITTGTALSTMDLSFGAGIVNLQGTFSNTTGTQLIGGSLGSVFNYNSSTITQTVVGGPGSIQYNNLWTSNTSPGGATLGGNITTTLVTGDLRVMAGLLITNGYNITGNAGKTFFVNDGATFRMTLGSLPPSGFSTYTFMPTSITQYCQNINIDITPYPAPGYGYLYVQPQAAVSHRFMNTGTTYVQSDLILGNGVNTPTIIGNGAGTIIDVNGSVLINPNTTLNGTGIRNILVGGDWINNGNSTTFVPPDTVTFDGILAQNINSSTNPVQKFNNLKVAKGGGLLSVNPFVSTINVNANLILDVTNIGTFNLPPTTNITGNAILNSGTLVSGSLINISGNWTNNGATFNPNNGLVKFTPPGGSIRYINGSASSQSFYNVELFANANNSSLRLGGSTSTLIINGNYTQTVGSFSSEVSPATVIVYGNFTLDSGTYNSVGTSGAINKLFLGGDISYNTPNTWVMSDSVFLIGTGIQNIGGTNTIPNFKNLILDNKDNITGVILNQPINIQTSFILKDGFINNTSTTVLTMLNGSNVKWIPTSGRKDSTFVKGYVKYQKASTGVSTLIFPVGADTVSHEIRLILAHSNNTLAEYTCHYIIGSANALGWTLPPTISWLSGKGYWEIIRTGPANLNYAYVKAYYDPIWDDAPDPLNLTIAKGNPTSWTDLNGIAGIDAASPLPNNYDSSSTSFLTFSFFSLANKVGGANPLPIQLAYFKATPKEGTVLLEWETYSEVNISHFTIEKTKDNNEFIEVDIVPAKGNTTTPSYYKTIDSTPFNGTSYYILKVINKDGNMEFARIAKVEFEGETGFFVYPNPTTGKFNVFFKSFPLEQVLIVVQDAQGKEFYSKAVVIPKGQDLIEVIDLEGRIPNGIYYVIGSNQNWMTSKKIIVRDIRF